MRATSQFIFGVPASQYWGRHPVKTVELSFFQDEPHYLERVKLIDIKEDQCHWPYGPVHDTRFCGRPIVNKSPFCECHYKRAFRTAKEELLTEPTEPEETENE